MIRFPRAPRVSVGDAVTSSQLAGLAGAFNARLRSGLGDATWRIAFYLLSMCRQVRNPDSSGFLWPSNAEMLEVYAMLDPEVAEWPVTEPGDPEGANLESPLPAYVFGNDRMELYDEASRLSDPAYGGLPLDASGPGSETGRIWQLGKLQRGAWDPESKALGCPAFTAARSFSRIQHGRLSPHGNAYGGWLATPELDGWPCNDPDPADDVPPPPNYVIKFKSLRDGVADLVFPGTCQGIPEGEAYAGHVAGIVYTPWAYYVFTNPETVGDAYVVQELSTSDWLEGPYDGPPVLGKAPGDHWMRIMDRFVRDFRGAWGSQVPAPEPGSPPAGSPPRAWLSGAFDFERFLVSQYPLAPARGVQQGDEVMAVYPTAMVGEQWFEGYEGCVHAGCYVSGGPGRVVIADEAGEEIDSIVLTASAPEVIRWFRSPPAAGAGVRVRAVEGSGMEVEMAQLMEYKPQLWDLFLVLRLSGAITEG